MNFQTMVRHSNKRRPHKGFTLLELLLVMAILVVLAGLGTIAYGRIGVATKVKACKGQIREIKNACMMYETNVGNFPRSLNDLVTLPSGMTESEWGGPWFQDGKIPTDPWKNAYSYSPNPQNFTVFVSSNGPDGSKGTPDDIPGQRQ